MYVWEASSKEMRWSFGCACREAREEEEEDEDEDEDEDEEEEREAGNETVCRALRRGLLRRRMGIRRAPRRVFRL